MNNRQVKIDLDMLGVVAYLSNSLITPWLIDIFEQIKEENVCDHLARRIMDSIPASEREVLVGFVCGRCELTNGTKLKLYDRGLLYDGCVPEAVQRYCRLYEKMIFQEW